MVAALQQHTKVTHQNSEKLYTHLQTHISSAQHLQAGVKVTSHYVKSALEKYVD